MDSMKSMEWSRDVVWRLMITMIFGRTYQSGIQTNIKIKVCSNSIRQNTDKEVHIMDTDETIHNSRELEFTVFCIENVAAKLGGRCRRCI